MKEIFCMNRFCLRMLECWRVVAKLFSFAVFGLGSLFVAFVWFPFLFVLSGFSKVRFKRWARLSVHYSMRLQVFVICALGLMRLDVKHAERLAHLKSKVLIANHPSLIDVVILFSLVPNADCIVKGGLGKNRFVFGIVRSIYILNSRNFDDQMDAVKESLSQGNNLIIFPEGTRSTPGESWLFKKGAARFAVGAARDVVPIYFGGNEAVGLRKKDKFHSFRKNGCWIFNLEVLEPISVHPYLDIPEARAVSYLTKEMKARLDALRACDEVYLNDSECGMVNLPELSNL